MQILSLEQIPSLPQWQRHDVSGGVDVQQGWRPRSNLGRQHVRPDRVARLARCHDQQPVHQVPQLPDIARPIIGLQCRQCVGRQCPHRNAGAFGRSRDKMQRQRRHILAPLAQGRDLHRHHGQAVIQILAEPPAGDFGLQVAVGRGQHPHINLDPRRPAQPFKGLVLQRSDNLALSLQRHVGHLVQQQRPGMRPFQHPRPPRMRRRIAAGLHAEQFFLKTTRI